MMGPWFYGLGWREWIWMAFTMLIPILVVGAFLYLAFRGFRRNDSFSRRETLDSPVEILKARYARGEITREEYLAIRKDIEQGG